MHIGELPADLLIRFSTKLVLYLQVLLDDLDSVPAEQASVAPEKEINSGYSGD